MQGHKGDEMAKIECSINTEDKSIEVTVDGKKVENFGYMSIYGSQSPYGYMFNMASIEEMDDCTKTTYWSHSNEFVNDVDDFLRNLAKDKVGKSSDDGDMDDMEEMPSEKTPDGKKKKKKMMKTEEKKKC